MGIKELQIKLIERTKDATVPLKVEALANAIDNLAPLLATLCNREDVEDFRDRLLTDFTEEELERIGSDPAFLIAILGNARVALERFVRG